MARVSKEIPRGIKAEKELLAELKKIEKEHRTLTLLFGAKDTENNQAVVLAEVLKKSERIFPRAYQQGSRETSQRNAPPNWPFRQLGSHLRL